MMIYHIDLEPDPSGRFTAKIREFPGCIAEGDNRRAAVDAILSVAQTWLEGCDESHVDPFKKADADDHREYVIGAVFLSVMGTVTVLLWAGLICAMLGWI